MVSVELSTREYDGQVVLALRGELDVADAAKVAASLAVVAASVRDIILDLEGLEFIDSSGLAALVRARAASCASPRPRTRQPAFWSYSSSRTTRDHAWTATAPASMSPPLISPAPGSDGPGSPPPRPRPASARWKPCRCGCGTR